MTPSDQEPNDSLLTKASNRLLLVVAIGFFGLGVIGVVLVAHHAISGHVWIAIVRSFSEALMVTGATTIIVSFALADSARLAPILKRALTDHASRLPTVDDIRNGVKESVAEQVDRAVVPLTTAVTCVGDDLHRIANAYVVRRENIYSHSITMLHELGNGEIRILMTAEEDLSTTVNSNGGSGEDWVSALSDWLSADFDSRRLYRVIASRPQSPSEMDLVKSQLLEPFADTNSDQWVYTDPEFALSVLLMGTRKAIFGFLPRAESRALPTARSRFEYAVVITSEMLVRNLMTWFDDRYTKDSVATKVMTRGQVNESNFSTLQS